MQCHDCIHFDPGYSQTFEEPGEPSHCGVADDVEIFILDGEQSVIDASHKASELIRNLHLALSYLRHCPGYKQRPAKVYPVRIYPPNKYDDTKQHTFAYSSTTRLEPPYSPEYFPE